MRRGRKLGKRILCAVLSTALCLPAAVLQLQAATGLKGDDGTAPVLVLGADLNEDERKEVLRLLGLEEGALSDCIVLTVTGEEVREALEDIYPEEQIEDEALSSVFIRPVYRHTGLSVNARNLSWCTPLMYQMLLTEAGLLSIEDERLNLEVQVAAPERESSGTAALVGALMACGVIRDQEIDEWTSKRAYEMALLARKEQDSTAEEPEAEEDTSEMEETVEPEDAFEAEPAMEIEGIGLPEKGQVDLMTGQLYLEQTDFPGSGESPVEFTRVYHSLDYGSNREENFFGIGTYWTHSYAYHAEIFRHNVALTMPDGTMQNWYKEYRKGWQLDDLPYTLEEGENGFLLTEPDGKTVLLGNDGWPTEITEANGELIELSYENGRLKRVSTENGYLEFSYQGDYIASITDSAGNQAFYAQDELGNLVQAVQPDGQGFSYAYDEKQDAVTGSNLISMEDKEGHSLLKAEYVRGQKIGGACQVSSLLTKGQPGWTFSYDIYEGRHVCQEWGGGSLELTYEAPLPDVYIWTWYDEEGIKIRQEEVPAS